MKCKIALQVASNYPEIPSRFLLQKWVNAALFQTANTKTSKQHELCIRVVDKDEIHYLNHTYRNYDKPTNVLSFPFKLPSKIDIAAIVLGDIVICAEVVANEAQQQHKKLEAHWAHMIVHGVLHLLGYDHVTDQEATIMETLEIEILQQLGFTNPYETILK